MKWYCYIVFFVLLQHCTSVSYVKKHQLKGTITSLTTETYETLNGNIVLKEKTNYLFTKNGRVKFSETFDINNNLIEVAEKKLWFIKRSYPNNEPYYCKTRWKPNNRERISCYTQKQYKKNEAIYHYNPNGSILKIVDNFTTFYTHNYHYNDKGEPSKITITNKDGVFVDTILITCKLKDTWGNCINLEKQSSKTNTVTQVISKPTYL